MPFSLHASTPGVCENRNGSSLPVLLKFCNSFFLMLATANGASFCTHTPFTTTSCNCSMRSESLSSASMLPADITMAKAIVIAFFIYLFII